MTKRFSLARGSDDSIPLTSITQSREFEKVSPFSAAMDYTD